MTKTFTTTQIQALRAIKVAARKAALTGMVRDTEVTQVIDAAVSSLQMSGSAYVCGETIILTRRGQDAIRSASIRSMSDSAFERFAYGL